MSNKAIDWGESTAEGDFGAAKKLVATAVVLIGVLALVVGTVGVAAMNAGKSLRGTASDVLSDTKESATSNTGSNHGYGGS